MKMFSEISLNWQEQLSSLRSSVGNDYGHWWTHPLSECRYDRGQAVLKFVGFSSLSRKESSCSEKNAVYG
jgi:hypothetical protein